MKARRNGNGLDEIDRRILGLLQVDCKTPLAKIGEKVGLSAPSVVERVRKLESEGFITGYHAHLDARRLGVDITAFIGVSIGHPKGIATFEQQLPRLPDVLECHHVTGGYTLLLKVKTRDTAALEGLIRSLRSIEGVERTETSVVLSTKVERSAIGSSVLDGATERAERVEA
jgi:Lrp/AsnC family transcriptional regulator, leucine-responsive regulatory protein